jgi:acetylornithine/succinyldiaminopimelate/putrescine aminotransferase
LRHICDEAGVLLVLDEVQSGMGRTGRLFAHEYEGVEPDIATCAKGLAGGVPIGAVLARETVAAKFVPGTHGSTFGANPVACRAASAVMDCLHGGGVMANCLRSSDRLFERLRALAAERSDITEVRGRGLMVGVEFKQPTKPIVQRCLEKGLIVNATAGNVLRLLPPLTITTEEIDEGIGILREALQ